MIEISVTDSGVQAVLSRLIAGVADTEPAFHAIGEYLMEISKRSFETSAAPDGTPWAPNTQTTILQYLNQHASNYGKDGRLSKKGAQRAAGKKPLIGHTRDLSRQFHYVADRNSVVFSNSMVYAAMQQFGGKKANYPNLWGDIPARPFMPIDASGNLDDAARKAVVAAVEDYIDALIGLG